VRRSAEFMLALDAYAIVFRRQRLEAARITIENEWRHLVQRLNGCARAGSVVIRGLPERPPPEGREFAIEAVVATLDGN
jgi:hypothetical protein